jgi:hypothetical protein
MDEDESLRSGQVNGKNDKKAAGGTVSLLAGCRVAPVRGRGALGAHSGGL